MKNFPPLRSLNICFYFVKFFVSFTSVTVSRDDKATGKYWDFIELSGLVD